jgi:hypothetical protein
MEQLRTSILESIADADKVKDILEKEQIKQAYFKEQINLSDFPDFNPLIMTAFGGYYKTTKILLEYGADPNQPQDNGITPLMVACDQGSKDRINFTHCETVKVLLDNGARAKINDFCDEGFNPLIFAAADGSLEIVKLLVDNGANVNVHFNNEYVYVYNNKLSTHKFWQWTPIMFAAYENHSEIVDFLKDKSGINSMQLMDYIRVDFFEGVRLCWDIYDKQENTKYNYTKLCPIYYTTSALLYKSPKVFEFLFSKIKNDNIKLETWKINTLNRSIPSDLWAWLVSQKIYTINEILSSEYKYKQQTITQLEALCWSGLMKCWYEASDKYNTLIYASSTSIYNTRYIEMDRCPLYNDECIDIGLNFPTPYEYANVDEINKNYYKENRRDIENYHKTTKISSMLTSINVSEIIDFIRNFEGNYFLDLFYEDLGASGMGGYFIDEYDMLIHNKQVVYCNCYSIDKTHGISESLSKTYHNIDDIITSLEYGHKLQGPPNGIYNNKNDKFIGEFLISVQGSVKPVLEYFTKIDRKEIKIE